MNVHKLGEIRSIFLALIIIAILSWFGFQTLKLVKQNLLNRQIDECIKSGKVEYQTENGTKVTEPSTIWYEKCLKDKGIR